MGKREKLAMHELSQKQKRRRTKRPAPTFATKVGLGIGFVGATFLCTFCYLRKGTPTVPERFLKRLENYKKLDDRACQKLFFILDELGDRRYFVHKVEQVEAKLGGGRGKLVALGKQIQRVLGDEYVLQFVSDSVGFAYRIAQMKQEEVDLEAHRKKLFGDELVLFNLLDKSSDVTYYSYAIDHVLARLAHTADRAGIEALGKGIEEKLGERYEFNIFPYTEKGIETTYCGFKYRKDDYIDDAKLR